jgi:hypothetical protein
MANSNAIESQAVEQASISANLISRNVNKLADLNAQIKALTKEADAIKGWFKTDLGVGVYQSADHTVAVVSKERCTLDTAAVKVLLSPLQIAQCSQITQYLQVESR